MQKWIARTKTASFPFFFPALRVISEMNPKQVLASMADDRMSSEKKKKKKILPCFPSHFFLSRSFSLLLFQTCVIACCLQAAVNTQKHWLTRLWRMGKGTCFFFSFPNDYTRACLFCYVRSNAVGTLHVWWRGQLYISGLQVTPWIWDVACMTWWWELSWALWKGTRCNYIHCRCMPMTLLFFSSLFQLHELEKEKKWI